MRSFHQIIISVDDVEGIIIESLRVRLNEGIQMLDGPRGQELEDVVHDIAAALLGKSIVLGPVLPESAVANGTWVHGLGHDHTR